MWGYGAAGCSGSINGGSVLGPLRGESHSSPAPGGATPRRVRGRASAAPRGRRGPTLPLHTPSPCPAIPGRLLAPTGRRPVATGGAASIASRATRGRGFRFAGEPWRGGGRIRLRRVRRAPVVTHGLLRLRRPPAVVGYLVVIAAIRLLTASPFILPATPRIDQKGLDYRVIGPLRGQR